MINLSRQIIIDYAEKYDSKYRFKDDSKIEKEMKECLAERNYLTREDFIKIGRWKSPRPTKHYESNSDDLVREVSQIAFGTKNEEIKIGILTLLNGCHYPLASVLLHFKYPSLYPIIDFRALWSLRGTEQKSIRYSYNFWQEYVNEIRKISKDYDVDLRTIDKALWKYSEENSKMTKSTVGSSATQG